MIGSGVDMSRAYMAKTRLQSACDAAALAGRRVMQNDTLDAAVIDEADRFFNFNFNQGLYGTAAFTPAVTRPSSRHGPGHREHDDPDHDHADVRLHHAAARRDLRRLAQLRQHRRDAGARRHRLDGRDINGNAPVDANRRSRRCATR